MFLDDDLDLQKAWKRLYVIVIVIAVVAVCLVFLFFLNFPKLYFLPLYSADMFLFLRVSSFYVEVEMLGITVFKIINFSRVLVGFLLVMFVWIPYVIVATYDLLIIRLARDGSFWFIPFSTEPSNRYQTFGEAKNRIKEISRKGTRKEKSAIYAFIVYYTVGFSSIWIALLLTIAGILPFEIITVDLVIFAALFLGIFVQWRMWNTIK